MINDTYLIQDTTVSNGTATSIAIAIKLTSENEYKVSVVKDNQIVDSYMACSKEEALKAIVDCQIKHIGKTKGLSASQIVEALNK